MLLAVESPPAMRTRRRAAPRRPAQRVPGLQLVAPAPSAVNVFEAGSKSRLLATGPDPPGRPRAAPSRPATGPRRNYRGPLCSEAPAAGEGVRGGIEQLGALDDLGAVEPPTMSTRPSGSGAAAAALAPRELGGERGERAGRGVKQLGALQHHGADVDPPATSTRPPGSGATAGPARDSELRAARGGERGERIGRGVEHLGRGLGPACVPQPTTSARPPGSGAIAIPSRATDSCVFPNAGNSVKCGTRAAWPPRAARASRPRRTRSPRE